MKIDCREGRSLGSVEEGFVVDVQSLLQELMDAQGVDRAQLAQGMGVPQRKVAEMFSDECRTFTIRDLARAMHMLGREPTLAALR